MAGGGSLPAGPTGVGTLSSLQPKCMNFSLLLCLGLLIFQINYQQLDVYSGMQSENQCSLVCFRYCGPLPFAVLCY